MIKKLVKKLAVALTLAGTLGMGLSFAACNVETDHPVVNISVEIRPGTDSAETYELEYTLYRNMYPNTVRHFIELADSGFYDNTLIHDYQSSDWFGGGYEYVPEAYAAGVADNSLAEYFNDEEICKEGKYLSLFESGALKPTVYSFAHPDEALPSLVGEFTSNSSPEIENGKFSADVGVLKMYYYSKDTKDRVLVKFMDNEQYSRNYSFNCATSLFAMQVDSGTSVTGSDYCVFGRINNGKTLNEMVEEVSGSIGSDARTISGIYVDNNEHYSTKPEDQGMAKSFRQASEAIVIRSVKVKKY